MSGESESKFSPKSSSTNCQTESGAKSGIWSTRAKAAAEFRLLLTASVRAEMTDFSEKS